MRFHSGFETKLISARMADVRANAMTILSSLSPNLERSTSSNSLLKRSSAMRSSRKSRKPESPTPTISLVNHKRQYSVDSHFSHPQKNRHGRHNNDYEHSQSPDMPFSNRYGDAIQSVRRHGPWDFDLPHPPNSRLSSLNFGRKRSGRSERAEVDEHDRGNRPDTQRQGH